MKDIRVELNDLDYSREKIKESKGLTALQKCRIFDAIDGARVILKEQQNQLFELQDHNEYLQDKLKEQEAVVPYQHDAVWLCGNCGKEVVGWDDDIDGKEYRYPFCRQCGQAVKWE